MDLAELVAALKQEHTKGKHLDSHRKLHSNPKLRQHFRTHEALMQGDVSGIHRRVDSLHRRMTGKGLLETGGGRCRLQADLEAVLETSCTKLVTCVRDYTLYDAIVYFYGPYVSDDGEIDDVFAEADVSDAANIWKKVEYIHHVLKRFEKTPKDTKGFEGECRSLLQLFHRNEKFDNFTQYHPRTWREVCRAEGAYKYGKFNEIKDKLGLRAADQVFDDMARCSTSLGEDMFFSSSLAPRVPLKVANIGISRDSYGKAKLPAMTSSYFEMQYMSVLQAAESRTEIFIFPEILRFPPIQFPIRPHYDSWVQLQDGYEDPKFSTELCKDRVDKYYHNFLMTKSNPNIFVSRGRTYPNPIIQCRRQAIMSTRDVYVFPPGSPFFNSPINRLLGRVPFVSDIHYLCDINAEADRICTGARFKNPTTCPANSFRIDATHDCTKPAKYEVQTLFRHARDRDTASTLAVGEKQSVGLVCAYADAKKETAGYCCLDAPYERDGNTYGNAFTCDLGITKCKNLAPKLAGFSEGSCDVYSGMWCRLDRTEVEELVSASSRNFLLASTSFSSKVDLN